MENGQGKVLDPSFSSLLLESMADGVFTLNGSLPAAGRESGRAKIGSERSHGRRSERSGGNIPLPFTIVIKINFIINA
ncbi:MAG: hypothetical protein JRJ01_08990 [Deltaproteobacteria bacterium]|nr:hypothetical protein [Deltaproteobacteria bacterium]